MSEPKLQLYGTDWCPKSSALRNYLQSKWIEFDDFNVETNAEADARIRALYDGKLKFPTVIIADDFIKNPTIPQLNEFLKKHNID
ncbi:glutaredoxin family protein [Catalinimonas niigatensis]|uniref:glutaredoxin family protein n=1 Tax=Catalinimonas niigatensis TaxID=1397264 RepID=UPI0026651833|nr:glutaredoxin domain-containing protein [Catalinimonas niigatensis]WPP48711.1 glutaredoxin domain-containing protein [Catalinimonas niigatensis]